MFFTSRVHIPSFFKNIKFLKSTSQSLLILLSTFSAHATASTIVVTLKPIYGLVAALTNGITTPTLLSEGRGSTHTLSLSPSDIKTLSRAELVIWVGESYEIMMAKPLQKAIPENALLTLEKVSGLKLYKQRTGGLFAGHSCQCCHEDHTHIHDLHDHKDEHGHVPIPLPVYNDDDLKKHQDIQPAAPIDGHFWLDIDNAKICAHAIATKIIQLWPQHSEIITLNLEKLNVELDALKEQMKAQLALIKGKSALIDHDSLQYIEKQFDFTIKGVLSEEPGMEPSPKQITALKNKLGANIKEKLIKVFFYSGNAHTPAPKLLKNLTSKYAIRMAPLDYVGDALLKDVDSYQACLKAIAAQLIAGFKETIA
ncbi:MAG: zinc ABC transporter substrate-binding protein [Candidatus Paracaedibacteraceae bacterium]|nr:zinc ABC transporter substrate-binding protein [Candidatus Paracaedibacteraceae bacterium]